MHANVFLLKVWCKLCSYVPAEWLAGLFKKKLGLESETQKEKLISSFDIDGIADYIKKKKCKNVITMAGAGISTCKNICLLHMIVHNR